MKARIKKMWMKALRSRRYKQTEQVLRDKQGFCCLGVLCDLHSKDQKKSHKKRYDWTIRPSEGEDVEYSYADERGKLPLVVRKWAGLSSADPILKDRDGLTCCASGLNDDLGAGFARIASAIERTL